MTLPLRLKLLSKWILWLLIVLVLLYALAYAWISFSAKREWTQAKKELEARGEKLSYVDFIPPPIPDAENFYSSPLFETVVTEPDGSKKLVLMRELVFRPPDISIYEMPQGMKFTDARGLTNLEYWAIKFGLRTKENQNQSAGDLILAASDKKRDLWEEFYRAAEKPGSRLPVTSEGIVDGSLQYALRDADMRILDVLSLRAVAYMEANRPDEAARDIMLMLRVVDTFSNDPSAISHLARMAYLSIATQKIREGIERGVWSASQLEKFENRLATENVLPELRQMLRTERGIFNETCMRWAQRDQSVMKAFFKDWYDRPNIPRSWYDESATPSWAYTLPWAGLYEDMAFFSRAIQGRLDILTHANVLNKNTCPEFPIPVGMQRGTCLFSTLSLPALESAGKKFIATQVNIDMTRIACALERYKIAYGMYPENPDQLVPQYIEKLPMDITSGNPYHYRRNAPDNFTLWSIGFDGVDDNAAPITRKNPEKGDWVWGVFTKK
ncbi:MAG: hypothetical protein ABI615_04135 [Chthoniobacterales bacterium]